MAGAATVANVPEVLKYIWDPEVREIFLYGEAPYFAMVEKDTSWEGLYQIVTLKFGGMAGRSTRFDRAKVNKSPNKFSKMQVETADDYALWSVDNKLLTLSRSNKGSLLRELADATESAMEKFKRSTIRKLWGTGGGSIGKIATAGISGSTFTLDDKNDIRNFNIDDVLEFAADDGYTGSGGVWSGTRTVTALDEDAGTVTVDSALSGIVGLAAGHFVFHDGDYANCLKGVPAYITSSAPGVSNIPTSIWGMTRTAHPTRFAGHRFTGALAQVHEEVKDALTKAHIRNCKITHLFMRPESFTSLEMTLESNRRYDGEEKVGSVGFRSLEFISQGGQTVKCFGDPDIRLLPNGATPIYGMNLDSWTLHTAEEYPMWLTEDGKKKFMTEENSNAVEGRIGGYGNLYTNSPHDNFVLGLT